MKCGYNYNGLLELRVVDVVVDKMFGHVDYIIKIVPDTTTIEGECMGTWK